VALAKEIVISVQSPSDEQRRRITESLNCTTSSLQRSKFMSMTGVGNLSLVAGQKQILQGMAGRTNFPPRVPFSLLFMMSSLKLGICGILIRFTPGVHSL